MIIIYSNRIQLVEDFDTFIPVGPNDLKIVKSTISNNLNKIKGIDNVYVFSEHEKLKIKNTISLENDFFPFDIRYIKDRLKNNIRSGWVYQQLLKLYFPLLQNKKENVLALDSDIYFTKKISFFNSKKPIYTFSKEFHKPYFEHMKKLHPDFTRTINKSGISHHMVFNKTILKEIVAKVESFHSKQFYDVFLESIDQNQGASASEYEIYFHFVTKNYNQKINLRELKWKNTDKLTFYDFKNFDMLSLPHYAKTRPDNIFLHIKQNNFRKLMITVNNFFKIFILKILNFVTRYQHKIFKY